MYKGARKFTGLSTEYAADLLHIGTRTLVNYENGHTTIPPETVLNMSQVYKQPTLCARHCAEQCPIGQQFAQPVEERDIAVSALTLLRAYSEAHEVVKEKYVAICDDNLIEEHELQTFRQVVEKLSQLESAISSIKLLAAQYIPDVLQKQKPAPARVAEKRVSYTKKAACAAR
ncbi:MAG: helix-turn-helix transcriptional regulator [Firmicutes bacterium]|nr:helix-turn-helix transcriptional regulator [Bacillota bacterium]